MRRTAQTAAILARPHGLITVEKDGLWKINHRHWEGMRRVDVETQFADEYAAWEVDPFTFAPQGGEAGVNVIARVLPIIRQVVLDHRGQHGLSYRIKQLYGW
jgi:probable phosphoglycerate mutase